MVIIYLFIFLKCPHWLLVKAKRWLAWSLNIWSSSALCRSQYYSYCWRNKLFVTTGGRSSCTNKILDFNCRENLPLGIILQLRSAQLSVTSGINIVASPGHSEKFWNLCPHTCSPTPLLFWWPLSVGSSLCVCVSFLSQVCVCVCVCGSVLLSPFKAGNEQAEDCCNYVTQMSRVQIL